MKKKYSNCLIVFALVFGFMLGFIYAKFQYPKNSFAQGHSSQAKLKWERVIVDRSGESTGQRIFRAKIPNGWLVTNGSGALTFAPDSPGDHWQ